MPSLIYGCNPAISGIAALTNNACKHPGRAVKLAFVEITGSAPFTTSATPSTDITLQSVWTTKLALSTNLRVVLTPELENFDLPPTAARVIDTQNARRMPRKANGDPITVTGMLAGITAADVTQIRALFQLSNRFGLPSKLAMLIMYENNMVRTVKATTNYFGIPVYAAEVSDPYSNQDNDYDMANFSFMLPYGWSVGSELTDIAFSPFDLIQ